MRSRPKPSWSWDRRKDDLRDELQAHLLLAIEDRVARGESLEAARAAALREMGNLPLVADVTRKQWGWVGCELFLQDLRYALRQLRKTPGYTATAILTLTLAIGANTAIFGLVYALLLRSLPVIHPEQIVQIKLQLSARSGAPQEPSDMVSNGIYEALAGHQHVFSGMCSWSSWPLNLRDGEGTRPVATATVASSCFPMLGVHAVQGRLFTEADDRPGGGPEGYPVVLGYDYWRTHLGADPGVIGRVLNIGSSFDSSDKKGVVVGVLEPGFESVQVGDKPWIYVSLGIQNPDSLKGFGSFDRTLLARLNDGVAPATARAEIDTIFNAALKGQNSPYYMFDGGKTTKATGAHLLVTPGRTGFSFLRTTYALPLYLIEGLVGLSLSVACAYLAMLASARALARRRELAVRIALGASRPRIILQLCCESLLLALAGSSLGVLFAWGAEHALVQLITTSAGDSPALQTTPSGVVLLFTLALSIGTVLIAGVLPAWRASRLDPVTDIKEGELSLLGRRRGRFGAWVVPFQVAFSLVILVVASLMASTLARLLAVDPGFRTSGVTFVDVDFSHRTQQNPKRQYIIPAPLVIALLDQIRHAPGVESASLSLVHPLTGGRYISNVSSTTPSGAVLKDELASVTVMPGYFQTLGIPLLSGRDFTTNDKTGAQRVCILNRSAADYFFPGRNPVSSTLRLGNDPKDPAAEVIAVVGDTHYSDLRESAPRLLYESYIGGNFWNSSATVSIRSGNTAAAVSAVRQALRQLAPDVAIDNPVTMPQLIAASVSRERLVAVLAGFFALLTLTLTAIGLYGLLSYAVVRRRTEIGIRMALGASRSAAVWVVLSDAMRMVLSGLLLGSIAAWATTRLLGSLLFNIKPLDPWACAASLALLMAAAILACVLPASRAASVDPMEALRSE